MTNTVKLHYRNVYKGPYGVFKGGTFYGSPQTASKYRDPNCIGVEAFYHNMRDRDTIVFFWPLGVAP
jgi:hypothetical protein